MGIGVGYHEAAGVQGRVELKVQFWGVRGSTPACGLPYVRYGGNTSCVVLTCGDAPAIVLDAGTGLRAWGDSLDPSALFRATALVTHLHLDHVQGLPFFTPLFRRGSRFDVYGPSQEIGSLEKAMTRIFRPPLHPVRSSELQGDMRFHEVWHDKFVVGDTAVTARPVPHLGRTIGYRVEHEGSAVAYISDHQAPKDQQGIAKGVLELAAGVDLLIHDAQYTPADWPDKCHWGHSTVAYAVRVATTAGARTLALYHHDPRREDDSIDALVEEARASFADGRCEVIGAREGMTVELTASTRAAVS